MFKAGDKVKTLVGDYKGCSGVVKQVLAGPIYRVTVENAPTGIPSTIVFIERDLQAA